MIGITNLNRPVYNATAREFAFMVNEMAKRSNSYALQLMGEGIRSDITANLLKRHDKTKKLFQSNGHFTKRVRKNNLDIIKCLFNLKKVSDAKKVTLEQILNKILETNYSKADVNLQAIKDGFKVIS